MDVLSKPWRSVKRERVAVDQQELNVLGEEQFDKLADILLKLHGEGKGIGLASTVPRILSRLRLDPVSGVLFFGHADRVW